MSITPSPILYFQPSGRKSGKAFLELPITDEDNTPLEFFSVSSSSCDEINSTGVSVEVPLNTPRYDYSSPYIEVEDNGYYRLDNTTGKVEIPVITFSDGEEWTVTVKGAFDEDNGFGFFIGGNDSRNFGLESGSKIWFRSSSFSKYQFNQLFDPLKNINTEYTFTCNGNDIFLYINGVFIDSITPDFTDTYISKFVKGYSSDVLGAYGDIYKAFIDNYKLTDIEVLDRYNGGLIPDKYKGANNFNFPATNITVGKYFKIITIGTTDWTMYGASSNTIGEEFLCTNIGQGTGTAKSIGNLLSLLKGKTSDKWYDLNHDTQGVLSGSVLNDGTDFGNNFNNIAECPVCLIEPSFTNYFLNSRTPITQTINGLTIGGEYTVNCKNSGIVSIKEIGGNGFGGTATEVYSFTYTATQTSVTITLESGHNFDWVQLSNTNKPMNHLETLGTSVTKIIDNLSIPILSGVTEIIETVEGVEQPPITNIPPIYTLPEGRINSVIMK